MQIGNARIDKISIPAMHCDVRPNPLYALLVASRCKLKYCKPGKQLSCGWVLGVVVIVFISNYMGSYKNQRAATTHVIKRAVITKLVINYQSALKSKMLNICSTIQTANKTEVLLTQPVHEVLTSNPCDFCLCGKLFMKFAHNKVTFKISFPRKSQLKWGQLKTILK